MVCSLGLGTNVGPHCIAKTCSPPDQASHGYVYLLFECGIAEHFSRAAPFSWQLFQARLPDLIWCMPIIVMPYSQTRCTCSDLHLA